MKGLVRLGCALILVSACISVSVTPALGSAPIRRAEVAPRVAKALTECSASTETFGSGSVTVTVCPRSKSSPSARDGKPAAPAAGVRPQILGLGLFWFSCGRGVTCYTYSFMTFGFELTQYWEIGSGAEFFQGQTIGACYDTFGCAVQAVFTPGTFYAVTRVYMQPLPPVAANVTPLLCWCGSGTQNCQFA